MILGCVLAGGHSSRFGSDKALAEIDGRTLIARTVDALSGWCEHVVVVGRETAPAPTLPDWPRPGMGPLGGIAGALGHAAAHGFDQVVTAPVDCVRLPPDLRASLGAASAFVETQPVVGVWSVDTLDALRAMLTGETDHAVRAFARRVGARGVAVNFALPNINRAEDLARPVKDAG